MHSVCVWYANNEIYITHTVCITLLWEKHIGLLWACPFFILRIATRDGIACIEVKNIYFYVLSMFNQTAK